MNKHFTRDLRQQLANTPVKRVAVFGYRACIDRFVQRYLYASHLGYISATLLIEPTDDTYDLAYVISDENYRDLPERLKRVKRGIFYNQTMADRPLPGQQALQDTDWQVIRALERKLLSDTPLHEQREAWRQDVDTEISNKALPE